MRHVHTARTALSALLLGAFLLVSGAPAHAALVDIVVVGTWDAASADPIQNPYGLTVGDRWVMKATYDDASLFFRADASSGVVSSLDSSVNPGTSFDVIIPHAGGAPNPLTFSAADHIDIGFAPTAEIMFDGASVMAPGSFRNFEIHTEFSFFNPAVPGSQDMHFDTFFGGVANETDIFNITDGGSISARAISPTQLAVVVNDIVADAGGPYVYNAATLTQALNGSFTGGSGFSADFDWGFTAGTDLNAPLASIADVGLTDTTDTSNILLTVTEDYTDFASAPDGATASYDNADPVVLAAMGMALAGGDIDFSATTDDADLAANALVAGFEQLGDVVFSYLGTDFLTGDGTLTYAQLLAIFGGNGIYSVLAEVTDLAGATGSLAFFITVPEPGMAALLLLGAVAAAGQRRGRARA